MPLTHRFKPTRGRRVLKPSAFDARLLLAAVARRQGGIPRCLYCLTGAVNGKPFCDLTCTAMARLDVQRYAAALGMRLVKARTSR